ncbi:glycosyl transferase [Cupriavidus necator]|uniref:Glycosyl transferase n=1 Tax=Cupriavidus necator TaxID=106590 RepID=A0A1U9UUX8_CUPNE|nr:glycosyltransferase [Cupriavidus necator]AQV96496.1 glycosyl transferase [Cupriavidus necator]
MSAKTGQALRVLHVYRTYFPDPPGGLQEAIRQIALSCASLGVESRVFTLSPEPTPHAIRLPEARVVRSRSWGAPASCDLGGPAAFLHFRRLTEWADVVHFHFPWPFGDLLRRAGVRNRPSVMTYHSDIVRQRYFAKLYRPLMRHTLRAMDAVVATSPTYVKTSPVLSSMVSPERLHVIPLGISDYAGLENDPAEDAAILARLGVGGAADEPYFLALGVLRYYKGLHSLIQAATLTGARIVIAGSGPEMERLTAFAQSRQVSNVTFLGQVSEREKIALLRHARALVLASQLRSEAFGMVLVEAAMFSKPMICCEIGSGTSYINQHGVTGLVVPPESPADLAGAITRLHADAGLAATMGNAARQRYETLFSGPSLGRAYTELYQELARQPHGR